MNLRIDDVMVRKVVTIKPETSVKKAARIMSYHSTSSLIVLEGDNIDGILTTRDVIARVVAKGSNPDEVLVKDVMSSPVVMLRPYDSLEEAVKIMLKRNIKKVLLVSPTKKSKKAVGILSLTDVVELFPKIFSRIKELCERNIPTYESDFYVS